MATRTIAFLALSISVFGALLIGLPRTLVLAALILVSLAAFLTRLRKDDVTPAEKRIRAMGMLYLALLGISIVLHTKDLRNDLIFSLAGIIVFLGILTAREVPARFVASTVAALLAYQIVLALFQYLLTGPFDALFGSLMEEHGSYGNIQFAMQGRLTSIWSQAPRLATITVACLPYVRYSLRERVTAPRVGLLVLGAIVVLMTGTRVAAIALVMSFLVFFNPSFSWKRLIVLTAVVAVVLVIATQFQDLARPITRVLNLGRYGGEYEVGEKINRRTLLLLGIAMSFSSPIFGLGNTFIDRLPAGWTNVHNSFLNSVLTYGYPATLLELAILGSAVVFAVRARRQPDLFFERMAVLAALCIAWVGLSHGVLFDPSLNIFFWLSLGLALRGHFIKGERSVTETS